MLMWAKILALAAAVSIIFCAGLKVGDDARGDKDNAVVSDAQSKIASHDKDVADAEKKARDEAQTLYEGEIAAMKAQAQLLSTIVQSELSQRQTLQAKLTATQNEIQQAAQHDKATEDFLHAAIPNALRNATGVRNSPSKAGPSSVPGGAGDNKDSPRPAASVPAT